MNFRTIRKRKKPNFKRGFLLILALAVILYLWFNAEDFITALFSTSK